MKFVEYDSKCVGVYYIDAEEICELHKFIENLKLVTDIDVKCKHRPTGGAIICVYKKD